MKPNNLIVIGGLIVAGIVARLIPHWPNFTPVLASALFAGVYMTDKKWAYMVPVITMALSDLFLPWHPTMFFVYGAIALVVFMGTYIRKPGPVNVAVASIAGSVLFFLITNFGEWAVDLYGMYPNNLSGLLLCYEAALPFANTAQWIPGPTSFATNQLAGDLVYSGIFFGGFELVRHYVPGLKPATVKA